MSEKHQDLFVFVSSPFMESQCLSENTSLFLICCFEATDGFHSNSIPELESLYNGGVEGRFQTDFTFAQKVLVPGYEKNPHIRMCCLSSTPLQPKIQKELLRVLGSSGAEGMKILQRLKELKKGKKRKKKSQIFANTQGEDKHESQKVINFIFLLMK
jgi:hypothetical protein